MDGVIVVDKPEGWTSHDAVAKMRRLAGTKRVGHLGTLDPMATGVLPLVVGRATRLAQFYVKSEKRYDAVFRFGLSTDSYDREGAPTSPVTEVSLEWEPVDRLFDEFRGPIQQVPPPISAKKIAGTPAYKLARRQQPVELAPVEVTIHSLEVLEVAGPDVRVRVHCSAGTYLRSLAHDAGRRLGCGAIVQQLRRESSGDFDLAQARTMAELEELSKADRIGEALIPGARLLPEFPVEIVDGVTASHIRQGRDFRVSPFRSRNARFVKAIDPMGELVAIGEAKLANVYHPVLVL
jgi:tRNA pseudouridine55 synthase